MVSIKKRAREQGVARGMAGGIVDGFEAIEIDKYQRMTLASPARLSAGV
jgi:hypothetical protein